MKMVFANMLPAASSSFVVQDNVQTDEAEADFAHMGGTEGLGTAWREQQITFFMERDPVTS